MSNLKALVRLQESLAKLPSVGKKSAERMAFAMLDMEEEDLNEFADAIKELKSKIHLCPICGNITEDEKCEICQDEDRDRETILVVSSPKDVIAFENAEGYRGLYHVLGGTISLSKGKGIEDLNIDSLLKRVQQDNIKEVIIATNPTVDGETTALYLAKLLENKNVNVTRLAYGLPMGGNLDYADALTLAKAIEGRRKI
ncbi:MAG: recombination protein RecR [Bacilli bacterium]|nr:recombination protein RecR [Bacilli bacterium]